jgi:two-component system chemotaxis response regulator CheB
MTAPRTGRQRTGLLEVEAIVIGASAGGVEALALLFEALPAQFVPSIIVVLHLPPDRPSQLARLYGQRCRLPVREAMDKERIEPGTIYFAPPDYHLLVEREKTLALSQEAPVAFSRPSIDVLFESAALAYGASLVAIVLTGANSDGAEGLAAVRAAGGSAWVQVPDDAQSETMPSAAIARAGADFVLPVRDMAERLVNLRSGRAIAT